MPPAEEETACSPSAVCSPASAASSSGSSGPGSGPSSGRSSRTPSCQPSTSSAVGSPARMCPVQAKALALAVLEAACGTSLPASSVSSRQLGLWSKTLPPEPAAGSMPSVGAWNDSATKRYRSLCRQRMSELRTAEPGCSSSGDAWTTPVASLGGPTSQPRVGSRSLQTDVRHWQTPQANAGGQVSRGGDRAHELLLAGQARWATPTARDCRGPHGRKTKGGRDLAREAVFWATPTASESTRGSAQATLGAAPQPRARPGPQLEMWPTPSATRYGSSGNGCPGDGRARYAHRGKPSLDTLAARWVTTGRGGRTTGRRHGRRYQEQLTRGERSQPIVRRRLNPTFVEWLMGFPPGHTAVVSAPSATPSSPNARKSSARSSSCSNDATPPHQDT